MLGLRATRAARLPCPYPSPCSAAQAASLSGPARRAPPSLSPAPRLAPPLAVSLLASARPVSSAWGSAMRPSGELPRPGTRVRLLILLSGIFIPQFCMHSKDSLLTKHKPNNAIGFIVGRNQRV
ncbi:rhodanese-like/PpiC domain-containing protein 12, chloroplastic [Hordeum vulgare]|nr:rhodanese-like/PpiC domain-containing protein 12, chloroplastic [Hordeum vulgare]